MAGDCKRGRAMSTHVHRDGAHQITVSDEVGREVVFVSEGRVLQINTEGEAPRLTPQMAHELADELHRWASCQQTVRTKGTNGAR